MGIYLANNRNPNDPAKPTEFSGQFSLNGLTDLRFGWAEVTGKKPDKYTLMMPSSLNTISPRCRTWLVVSQNGAEPQNIKTRHYQPEKRTYSLKQVKA